MSEGDELIPDIQITRGGIQFEGQIGGSRRMATDRALEQARLYLENGGDEAPFRLREAIGQLENPVTASVDLGKDARRHTAAHLAVEYVKENGAPRKASDGEGAAGREIAAIAREIEKYLREG